MVFVFINASNGYENNNINYFSNKSLSLPTIIFSFRNSGFNKIMSIKIIYNTIFVSVNKVLVFNLYIINIRLNPLLLFRGMFLCFFLAKTNAAETR